MFRIRTALAGATLAAVALFVIAAPASAHDELVSSSPAFDEQLTTVPEQVVLTFSDDLLELEGNNGTAMTVVDESGTDWVGGDPVVSAETLTVPLKSGMPNGDFTVTWKVVSSDGHPTSGDYTFSLAATQTAPAPSESTPPAETAQPSSPAQTQSPAPAPAETETAPWPLLIGLGVLLLAAIIIAIVITARKRRS